MALRESRSRPLRAPDARHGAAERRVGSTVEPVIWDTHAVEDAGRWAALRDAWLRGASAALTDDPRVAGWGLVGSFGRGEADDWSDVDLLVFVRDADFGAFIDPERNALWATAQLLVDARRNTPIGAMSVATLYVRSGLPISADWYVYPSSMAAWPDDCEVVHGADAAPRTDAPFAQWNGDGPRNQPLDLSPAEELQARLAMVPIAGKYIARRSPSADGMLQFLGARAPSSQPATQLEALQGLVAARLAECPAWLVSTVSEYLSLVALTVD
jgi:predicted nucleotidyltransferase